MSSELDFTDDEIVETYQASQAEQIQNLNAVIIQLRAQLVLQDKKLNGLDSKKEALDLALERVSGVDKVISQLQKEVKYYEDNVELVWKRRIRPEKLIKDKAKSVQKDKTPKQIINPAKDLLEMRKNYEVHTERYNDKIDFLNTENKNLRKELKTLRQDNDNMPIPQSVQRDISNKISELEENLKKAVEEKTFYMNLCYQSKDVDDSIIINKETKNSPRRGLGEVLKAK